MKLAILTSHVIQYQTPLFRKLAREPGIKLTIYFCWDFGAKRTFDSQFGKEIMWDIPLLEGFRHHFLPNLSPSPSSDFWGQVNPGIVGKLKRGGYDALLVYGWNSFTNWLAFFAAFTLGIPMLLHGESPLRQEHARRGVRRAVKRLVLPWLFRRVAAFLYIGEENREFYEYFGVPKEKLFFTPYAVDNERLFAEAERLRMRKGALKRELLGLSPNIPVVLFVGKLMAKKRPLDLLEAYRRVPFEEKALVFVGDGELRGVLESQVREEKIPHVFFEGFRNQTELPRYYALADVFVLPSGAGETWGLVVNEAMCFGVPVIVSSEVGCGPDLVREGENGYTFPVGDVDELARRLGELIRDPARRKSFGTRSREIVRGYSHTRDIEGIRAALRAVSFDAPR